METKLGLQDGLVFDYTQMFGAKRLAQADLDNFKSEMEQAAEAVRKINETGFAKAHLSKDGTPEHVFFPRLASLKEGHPNTEASIKALEDIGAKMKGHTDVVLSLGIGGSFLGDKVLFDVAAGDYWNEMSDEERGYYPRVYFSGNNLDPVACVGLYKQLERLAAKKDGPLNVNLIVISKSGTTLETLGSFSYFYDILGKEPQRFNVEVTAVTGMSADQSVMFRLAEEKGWPVFEVPEGVGGRFSVLSNCGLILAAAIGMNIRELLKGAGEMADYCLQAPAAENPALTNAALKFIAQKKLRADIEVFMGYGANLKSVGEWYVQLLAESLGKRMSREGELVNYGRSPIVAVGTTDMHAQTQQHQDGKRNKVVQFLQIAKPAEEIILGDPFPSEKAFGKYAGREMSRLLLIAMESNEQALASDERMSARYILPALNARYLGQLFMFLMFSIAYEGELADVDAYDQPGVEAYKKIMNATIAKL